MVINFGKDVLGRIFIRKVHVVLLSLITGSAVYSDQITSVLTQATVCEDKLETVVEIDPELRSKFFNEVITSYPPHIVDNNGKLEDTLDGVIDDEDRIELEHTAKCISDHQGKHEMSFCSASMSDGTTTLVILSWRITKKTIRLKQREISDNARLYGYVSVEFEERSIKDGKILWTPYKIEGFVKPVVKVSE